MDFLWQVWLWAGWPFAQQSISVTAVPPQDGTPIGIFLAIVGGIVGFALLYIFLFRRRGCRTSSFFAAWGKSEPCDPGEVRRR